MNQKEKIRSLINQWAEFQNAPVDCDGIIEFISLEVAIYLDGVINEIYGMIHQADFIENSKIENVYKLISTVNKFSMEYIKGLEDK